MESKEEGVKGRWRKREGGFKKQEGRKYYEMKTRDEGLEMVGMTGERWEEGGGMRGRRGDKRKKEGWEEGGGMRGRRRDERKKEGWEEGKEMRRDERNEEGWEEWGGRREGWGMREGVGWERNVEAKGGGPLFKLVSQDIKEWGIDPL